MNAEIISVGTELLLGKVVNTDTTIIAKALAGIGVNLLYASTVGDNPKRLSQLVETALERSDVIITTGGLGPTQDDLTKVIVAKTCGTELVMHEDVKDELIAKFKNHITENQLNQAMLPIGCHILVNDNGTAPGCVFETKNKKLVMMLPGPPSELEPMFKNYGIPYLLKDNKEVIYSKNIRVYGRGEGEVAQFFDYLMHGENPSVAPYADEGEMYLRITAKAKDKETAKELLEPIKNEICDKLKNNVYTVEFSSLEETVVNKLKEKNMTVASAESCTGGLFAKRITDISGSSDVFETGLISYSNDTKIKILGVDEEIIKNYGAVSEECARDMAEKIIKFSGSDIGVGITGIAGPDGGSDEKPVGLVYIAVSDGENTFVVKRNSFSKSKNRQWHRHTAASHALDMVRRMIDKIEVVEV